MKKNKIIIGSSVAALAIIGMGAFAFFSDHAEDDTVGTVGTVDVIIPESGALDLSNKENINPGDEKTPYDPENPGATTPHKLSFGVQNDGTKSIRTRNIIDIIVTSAEGDNLDPTVFALSEKADEDPWANTELSELTDLDVTKFTYVNDDDQTVLRYIITGASLNGEAGKLEDADITADDVARDSVAVLDEDAVNAVMYDYYLSMEGYLADEDGVVVDALDAYQGATVQINLEVQAMQYRNTTGNDVDGDWVTVLTDTVVAGN